MLCFISSATWLLIFFSKCHSEKTNGTENGNVSVYARKSTRQGLLPPDSNLAKELPPIDRILMSGGFSNPCPSVYETMLTHVTTFREEKAIELMDEIVSGLRYVFQTRNNLTFPVTGSGAVGMATVLNNLVEPGDKFLVGVSGRWSLFAAELAERLGAQVTRIEKQAGQTFSLRALRLAVKRIKPDVLYLVHGISSTGAHQPMHGIGNLCREFGCLFIVDVVSTMAARPLYIDNWKVDAAFANSQKGLGSLVGVSPLTFNHRAWERYKRRKAVVPDQTQDLGMLATYWTPLNPTLRVLTYTTPLQQLFALREGLSLLAKETLPKRWSRVSQVSSLLTTQLMALGFTPFVTNPNRRLFPIMTYNPPPKVNVTTLREFALNKYHLDLGAGFYKTAESTLRVGLFTCNAVPERVEFVVKVVAEGVQQQLKNKSK